MMLLSLEPRGTLLLIGLKVITKCDIFLTENLEKYSCHLNFCKVEEFFLRFSKVRESQVFIYFLLICGNVTTGCRVFRCKRKYEFIDVMMASDRDGDDANKLRRVIVDLDFKSQFQLAKQTSGYKDVTEMLPTIFVASEARLKRVVSLVCNEMKKSMKEEGMPRPPWRTKSYMQAKWLSVNRLRVSASKKGSWSMFDDGQEGEDVGTMSRGGTGLKTKCCFPIF